jgi:ABC-2 type transport system ATP-binding protein
VLAVEGLHKRFGEVRALDGCGLTVRPGEMVGLLGPNGAGKATLMRTVFGLVRPDAGSVSWKRAPITPPVRRRFGYMPEERGLYPKMPVLRVLSLLPPWSPLVMPGRIARGWAEPWEVALSLALMIVVAYGMVRLAGRIYLGGVTQATRSVGWREALRAGRDLHGA